MSKYRVLTEEESLEIISSHLQEDHEVLNFKNHRKYDPHENTFRFTMDLISLEFLISLMEDEYVRNVYFSPSAPPPGQHLDGISMRYKIYVHYHEVEDL